MPQSKKAAPGEGGLLVCDVLTMDGVAAASGLAEGVVAGFAVKVVEDALVDDGADLGTDQATGGCACQCAEKRTSHTAQQHAGWARNGADRAADPGASENARSTTDCADEAARLLSVIEGRDVMRVATRTLNGHGNSW